MRSAILIACAALVLLAIIWEEPDQRLPPGVSVPYEPEQDPIDPPHQWLFQDAQVTALANFRVRGRVLLTQHYSSGAAAAVSPVDLTLGWRLMSNQDVLDGLQLFSRRRAYVWQPRNGRLPASERDIIAHSANMHMVAPTPELADRLRAIHRGDLVDIRGYLVEVKFSSGAIWRSSLTREDSGEGACELVWVGELSKLR